MKPKLIIYGIGSMASTYAMYLEQHFDIVAFTMTKELISSPSFNNKPLLPFEEIETLLSPSEHLFIVAVGYIEFNQLRANIAAQAQDKGFNLTKYVSPSMLGHNTLPIGNNSVILEPSSVHHGSQIGNNTFISSNVQIGHDCMIGNNVWINAGVCLGGGVTIGDDTFVCMNATIAHDVVIGEKNFIGAATLVTKSTNKDNVVIAPSGEVLPMNSETFLRFSKSMNND